MECCSLLLLAVTSQLHLGVGPGYFDIVDYRTPPIPSEIRLFFVLMGNGTSPCPFFFGKRGLGGSLKTCSPWSGFFEEK